MISLLECHGKSFIGAYFFQITVTYKTNCPDGEAIDGCFNFVSTTNEFYRTVIDKCQNKTGCSFRARQIPIPQCGDGIPKTNWGNFLEIHFDCILNGKCSIFPKIICSIVYQLFIVLTLDLYQLMLLLCGIYYYPNQIKNDWSEPRDIPHV